MVLGCLAWVVAAKAIASDSAVCILLACVLAAVEVRPAGLRVAKVVCLVEESYAMSV